MISDCSLYSLHSNEILSLLAIHEPYELFKVSVYEPVPTAFKFTPKTLEHPGPQANVGMREQLIPVNASLSKLPKPPTEATTTIAALD